MTYLMYYFALFPLGTVRFLPKEFNERYHADNSV